MLNLLKLSSKQLIKTTEQSLALNSSEQTIRLLNKHDIDLYKHHYHYLHIGMVQIAFKPLRLTLKQILFKIMTIFQIKIFLLYPRWISTPIIFNDSTPNRF